MKLRELRRIAAEKLTGSSEDRPLYAVDLMLCRALDLTKSALIVKYEEETPPLVRDGVLSMAERRAKGEPLSYILGEAEFYGRTFLVGEGVLIPRPETELLVEGMLQYARDGDMFADWCTGSGCIGITILLETAGSRCVGIDSNRNALSWARKNIEKHSLTERFAAVLNSEPSEAGFGDVFFDFIVANPPYIRSGEIAGLMRDVRDYEPADALDGGEEGIDLYVKFFAAFPRILKPGGYFGMEIADAGQADKLLKIVPNSLELEQKIYDYSGILRHLIWRRSCVA